MSKAHKPYLIFDPPTSPFEEGYNSAHQRDGAETLPCPYAEGTPEHDKWWEGFCDEMEQTEAEYLDDL